MTARSSHVEFYMTKRSFLTVLFSVCESAPKKPCLLPCGAIFNRFINGDYKAALNHFMMSGTHSSNFFDFCEGHTETYYLLNRFSWNCSSWLTWTSLHGKQQQTFLDNQLSNKAQERQGKLNRRRNPWAENKLEGCRVEQEEDGTVVAAGRALGCWTVLLTTRLCLQATRRGLQGTRACLTWVGETVAQYQRARPSFGNTQQPIAQMWYGSWPYCFD